MSIAQTAYNYSQKHDGPSVLSALQNGEISVPACDALSIRYNRVSDGKVYFDLAFDLQKNANHMNRMHDGMILMALDHAAGFAMCASLEKDKLCVSQSLTAEFHHFVTARTGALHAVGWVDHEQTAKAVLVDQNNKIYAEACVDLKVKNKNNFPLQDSFNADSSGAYTEERNSAFCKTLGIMDDIDAGCSFLPVVPDVHFNQVGCMHGGIIAALANAAVDSAYRYSFPDKADRGLLTTYMSVNYYKPVTLSSGVLRAHTTNISMSDKCNFAEVNLYDKEQQKMASALLHFKRR